MGTMVMDINCVQNASLMPLLNMVVQQRLESSVVLIVHTLLVRLQLVQEEVMLRFSPVHFVLQVGRVGKFVYERIVGGIPYHVPITLPQIGLDVNIQFGSQEKLALYQYLKLIMEAQLERTANLSHAIGVRVQIKQFENYHFVGNLILFHQEFLENFQHVYFVMGTFVVTFVYLFHNSIKFEYGEERTWLEQEVALVEAGEEEGSQILLLKGNVLSTIKQTVMVEQVVDQPMK